MLSTETSLICFSVCRLVTNDCFLAVVQLFLKKFVYYRSLLQYTLYLKQAPDWILAEVNVLSKFSSVRMKLVCRQVMDQIFSRGINWEKVTKLTTGERLNFGIKFAEFIK